MNNISRLRDYFVAVCFLVLLLLIAMKLQQDEMVAVSGNFYAVDGDSLKMNGTRYRLLGIDAPELKQRCMKNGSAWPCGEAARSALAGLLKMQQVQCSVHRKDKFQRLLVACLAGALDINREMVKRGMAVSFGGYEKEEAAARSTRAGIWAGEFERPVDWRRGHMAQNDDGSIANGTFFGGLFGRGGQ